MMPLAIKTNDPIRHATRDYQRLLAKAAMIFGICVARGSLVGVFFAFIARDC
jgi:hypothetical protein